MIDDLDSNSDFALIDSIKIASPCSMDWSKMSGDERKRYCDECQLHVFNLKEMTRAEIAELVMANTDSERLCMQLYRRHDGTIITKDCPLGLKEKMERLAGAARQRFLAAAGLIAWLGLASPAQAQILGDKSLLGDSVTRGRMSIDRPEPAEKESNQYDGKNYSGSEVGKAIVVPPPSCFHPSADKFGDVSGISTGTACRGDEDKLESFSFTVALSMLFGFTGLMILAIRRKAPIWILGGLLVGLFFALGILLPRNLSFGGNLFFPF